jgi:ribonuclease HII
MKVAGVDEAGKGPVIGSMYVAGVMIDEFELEMLNSLDLHDSKQLRKKRREELAVEIEKLLEDIYVLEVSAERIDELRERMTMNEIMVISFASVLRELRPDKVFLDAADVNAARFAANIRREYHYPVEIISEHNADEHYPIVSAASIIAKVRRDRSIRELEMEIRMRIGSGYPSDPTTRDFLRSMMRNGDLPSYVRHSWKTIKTL